MVAGGASSLSLPVGLDAAVEDSPCECFGRTVLGDASWCFCRGLVDPKVLIVTLVVNGLPRL